MPVRLWKPWRTGRHRPPSPSTLWWTTPPATTCSVCARHHRGQRPVGRHTRRRAQAQISGAFGTNDTIQFANGLTGIITLNGNGLPIAKNVTISGPGQDLLTLDAAHQSGIFGEAGVTAALSGLSMINSSTSAIGTQGGIVTVTGCTFSNNTGTSVFGGGAISVEFACTLNVSGCTFTGNSAPAGRGGAIDASFFGKDVVNVMDSTFINNSAAEFGGAIGSECR